MKTIPEEIEELRALTVPELTTRYRELFGKDPRVKNRSWLWRRIAWKIQEIRFGGLTAVAKRRLEELIAELDLPAEERTVPRAPGLRGQSPRTIAVGTTLVRTWRRRDVCVRVVEKGFEYEGQIYESLSAVAKAITGSHWNGRLFFGLTERKKRR